MPRSKGVPPFFRRGSWTDGRRIGLPDHYGPTENRAQDLTLAVSAFVLSDQEPPTQVRGDDWALIQRRIKALQARENTDVWDSWAVTAEVCALIDASFRRTDEKEWDLSRDVPFHLILDSVNLLLESRLGRRPSASEQVRQTAQVLADHLPTDAARFLGELLVDQEQGRGETPGPSLAPYP